MSLEIWKPVIWYEWYYEVSSIWRIKSLSRERNSGAWNYYRPEKIMESYVLKSKYRIVCFSNKIEKKSFYVHRLVAEAFIPNPANKPCINHINWIKTDNRVENLERCTYSENELHSVNILKKEWPWLWKFGSLHYASIPVVQYDLLWNVLKIRDNIPEAARELHLSQGNICTICLGKPGRTTCGGFKRKYK